MTIFQFFVWVYVQVCLPASQSVGGSQRSNLFQQVPEVSSRLSHIPSIGVKEGLSWVFSRGTPARKNTQLSLSLTPRLCMVTSEAEIRGMTSFWVDDIMDSAVESIISSTQNDAFPRIFPPLRRPTQAVPQAVSQEDFRTLFLARPYSSQR